MKFHCVYVLQFINISVGSHWFHFLAMEIVCQVYMLRSGIAGSYGTSMFSGLVVVLFFKTESI